MTAGFVTVFGVFGIVVSLLSSSIQEYLPWITAALAVVLGTVVAVRSRAGRVSRTNDTSGTGNGPMGGAERKGEPARDP